ncbi:MAG: L,D-transpeptidase YcbB [Sphingomonadales bacterium]|jgi:murein L,D-transpeptidase YcbB/YkuD|nr:L,D-transpeptidase YcbB [Sphingomonadales bacterium]
MAVPPEIAAFYRTRGNRPGWMTPSGPTPAARALAARLASAGDDGLDPARYRAADVAAAVESAWGADPKTLARAELLLSTEYVAYARDVALPRSDPTLYAEPGLGPVRAPAAALLEAPSLRLNPLYEALRRGYGEWRRRHRDPKQEALVRLNLDRARAIPASAPRYVIVDTASARLWMIEGERVEGPMKVIVGKPAMQTPVMAGRIRYVVLNPWWNVPPDLARERAKTVVKEGPGLIARQRLEILSDWSDSARPIPASAVNWRAVAAGQQTLRLRQRPGGDNVMGAVKFMMPNRLGIYLHDFPDRSLFDRADRRLSSGCVRLADAPRLLAWLYRGRPPAPRGAAPEQRVDLPEPVPVYITYLTVLPGGPDGLTFQPDSYGRDRGPPPPPRPATED